MSSRVLVIGGGMVGLAFAIAAGQALSNSRVTVIEARPLPQGNPNPLDTRASALNLASQDILTRWSIWPDLDGLVGVINQIHVSQRGHFGSSLMVAEDVGAERLGSVAENHLIGRALKTRADSLGIELRAPVTVEHIVPGSKPILLLSDGEHIEADLVIVADGIESSLRRRLGISTDRLDMGQSAVVANCSFSGEQQGTAFERFTADGPLALLPLPTVSAGQQRFNMVWSMTPESADTLMKAADSAFLSALQSAFGWRLGKAQAVGRRTLWPLERVRAKEQTRAGLLVAGNAAHGLHPVAGQGLNLSLRDAATLEQVLILGSQAGLAPGDPLSLARYQDLVSTDQALVIGATDSLATLFRRRGPLLDWPRDAALAGLDLLPPLRQRIAHGGTGAAFMIPPPSLTSV